MLGGGRPRGGHGGVGVGGGASILEQGRPGSILSPSVTWPPQAFLPPSPHRLAHPNEGGFSEMEYGDPECFRRKLGHGHVSDFIHIQL